MKFYHRTTYLLLLVLIVACVPQEHQKRIDNWVYADLRSLDPVDALLPSQDLIAIYTRTTGNELQIRLDFLEQELIPDFDLYLALDTMPGGRRDMPIEATTDLDWDYLLIVPASGNLRGVDSNYRNISAMGLFTMRNFLGDSLILGLNKGSLSTPGYLSASNPAHRLQVFITQAGSKNLADRSAPVSTVSLPPPPARVLFVFWNTYPAYSPVTALRCWNGAHTGPLGGNHGLFPLLSAAQNSGIPLVLLDLMNPASLSALDFSDNLDLVKSMVSQEMLILPNYLPDIFPVQNSLWDFYPDQIVTLNRNIGRQFGIPDSPFASTPQGIFPLQPGTQLIFSRKNPKISETSSLKPVKILRWRDRKIIPLQMDYDLSLQATLEGPALDVRQSLIETAIAINQASSTANTPFLILGGDLSNSTWGVFPMAHATFSYLKEHPWVQFLSAQDLLSSIPESYSGIIQDEYTSPGEMIPTSGTLSSSPYQPAISTTSNDELLASINRCLLDTKPQNSKDSESLCEAALQAYLALFNPVSITSNQLPTLRANYVGQVWSLLEAADWAESPRSISTCETDPDRDEQPECILASEDFYAQFEIIGGSLSYAFWRDPRASPIEKIHQVVGPSSQFITGLSDPSTWDLSAGSYADPSVITGAFAENALNYQAHLEADKLIFTATAEDVTKTYQLTPNGVHVEYTLSSNTILPNPQIPLVLDPWRRFYPDWTRQFQPVTILNGWGWQLRDRLRVEIQTNALMTAYSFEDSLTSFSSPEDPNQDYPPGHFLPFPFALVEIKSQGKSSFYVDIIPVFQIDLD